MTDSPQKPDYPAILEHCQRALNGLLKGRGQNAIKDARMAECLCRVALEAIERDEKFLALCPTCIASGMSHEESAHPVIEMDTIDGCSDLMCRHCCDSLKD